MKKKILTALMLSSALVIGLAACSKAGKKDTAKTEDPDKDVKIDRTADEIEEREIKESKTYTAVLGDYTIKFGADDGFVKDTEDQMPEDAVEQGAHAFKFTNDAGEEIFISYTPEEMTPNVGNATNAEEYMKLDDEGITTKWAEDFTTGNWKGYHYKATTAGGNQVGYDLYHNAQEIKISISSASEKDYPNLENIVITGEKKDSGSSAQQSGQQSSGQESAKPQAQEQQQKKEEAEDKDSPSAQPNIENEKEAANQNAGQASEEASDPDEQQQTDQQDTGQQAQPDQPQGEGDPDEGMADEDGE